MVGKVGKVCRAINNAHSLVVFNAKMARDMKASNDFCHVTKEDRTVDSGHDSSLIHHNGNLTMHVQ